MASSEPSSEEQSENEDGGLVAIEESSDDGKISPVTVQKLTQELSMKFVSSHFNDDSDDSEEEKLTTGLNFDVTDQKSLSTSENLRTGNSSEVTSLPFPVSTSCNLLEVTEPTAQDEPSPEDSNKNVTAFEGDSITSSSVDDHSGDTARRSISRQNSTPSVVDLSDYEVVSESELS